MNGQKPIWLDRAPQSATRAPSRARFFPAAPSQLLEDACRGENASQEGIMQGRDVLCSASALGNTCPLNASVVGV